MARDISCFRLKTGFMAGVVCGITAHSGILLANADAGQRLIENRASEECVGSFEDILAPLDSGYYRAAKEEVRELLRALDQRAIDSGTSLTLRSSKGRVLRHEVRLDPEGLTVFLPQTDLPKGLYELSSWCHELYHVQAILAVVEKQGSIIEAQRLMGQPGAEEADESDAFQVQIDFFKRHGGSSESEDIADPVFRVLLDTDPSSDAWYQIIRGMVVRRHNAP